MRSAYLLKRFLQKWFFLEMYSETLKKKSLFWTNCFWKNLSLAKNPMWNTIYNEHDDHLTLLCNILSSNQTVWICFFHSFWYKVWITLFPLNGAVVSKIDSKRYFIQNIWNSFTCSWWIFLTLANSNEFESAFFCNTTAI